MLAGTALPSIGILLLGLLAACGGGLQPLHNVRSAPVVAPSGREVAPQNVRDAIMRALASRGWQLDREGPDGIVATVVSGGHSATILIQYDTRSYSINYLDSSPGLKFNGTSIHRRYNDWIVRLDRSIRQQLSNPETYGAQAAVAVGPAPPSAVPQANPAPTGQPAPPAAQPQAAVPAPPAPPAAAPPPAAAAGTNGAQGGGKYEAPPPPPPPPAAAPAK